MTILASRPRIWLSPAILATLKARAARGTSRWRILKDLVDRPGADWDIGICNYALAYQVTGDPAYAAKAIDLMTQSMAAGLGQVQPDSGYPCRSYFVGSSLVLDYCWEAMTDEERASLIADVETNAAWVWPETNPSRASAWGVNNPGNNYFHGFMMTWLAAVALGDSSRKSAGLFALCQSKWENLVLPYLAGPAAGGYMVEGTSYGVDSVRLMLLYQLALLTGTDMGSTASLRWPLEACRLLMYLTAPTMDRLVPWGDQTKDAGGALRDPSRSCQLIAAGAAGVGAAQGWLDTAVPPRMQERINAWEEFLWYPEERTAEDYTKTWPVMSRAVGSGVLLTRSDWSPTATAVAIEAGPVLESHQDRAAGSFGLFAGDWLASWAKITGHSGIAQETFDSNCVVIGGARQMWTQDQVRFTTVEDTPAYTYAVADLTAAYAAVCSGYQREYLFLRPGLLVVRDRIEGAAAQSVSFSVHAGRLSPVVDSLGYQVQGDNSQLFGTVVRPDAGHFSVVKLTTDREPGVNGWRLDLASGSGREFLIGFETAPRAQIGRVWQDFDTAAVIGLAGAGGLAGWLVNDPPWRYYSPGAGPHVLIGAQPGRSYQIAGGTVTASAGGILMFNGPPAGTQITVTAAGGGGGDLTARTWNVVSGTLETNLGTITLTGGQLVVTALPGALAAPEAPKKGRKR